MEYIILATLVIAAVWFFKFRDNTKTFKNDPSDYRGEGGGAEEEIEEK